MTSWQQLLRFGKQHWLTICFIFGFITDSVLLNRVDDLFDNLVLLAYVVLATAALLLFYVGVAERGPVFLARSLRRYAPTVMQYAFGGLLSGMLIFYGRSGDWLASAPFLLLIVVVIIGNEVISKRSDRLLYQLTLYFTGLFSYVVLIVPVLIGDMGISIFILSGLIALMVVTFVVQVLYRIIPNYVAAHIQSIIVTIGAVYVTFNVLYFTSLIPPIPLSLTELSIVQSVDATAVGGLKQYRVTYEEQSWYRQLPFITPVIHPTKNTIACFARVYAPTKLSTKIYHRWEYKDSESKWQEQSRIGYEIMGSNKNGYGGYTQISSFFPGVWRCSVETERGQVLGRETVTVSTPSRPVVTKTQVQ